MWQKWQKSHVAEMASFATGRHKWLLVAFSAISASTATLFLERQTACAASRTRLTRGELLVIFIMIKYVIVNFRREAGHGHGLDGEDRTG